MSSRGDQLSLRVAAALAAAEIPPSKLGVARRARLSPGERELYFWILRRFAESGRPSSAEVRDNAVQLGLRAADALATLAREDLVHLGRDREIEVAYPFSGPPTAHRVRFPSGHEAHAMCAIDALGIAPMFEEPIEIESRDPWSGDEIQVRVAPNIDAEWRPDSVVVVSGTADSQAAACRACCPVLNFFASRDNAEDWLSEHAEVRGEVISMEEAILAGQAVFGGVLSGTSRKRSRREKE